MIPVVFCDAKGDTPEREKKSKTHPLIKGKELIAYSKWVY